MSRETKPRPTACTACGGPLRPTESRYFLCACVLCDACDARHFQERCDGPRSFRDIIAALDARRDAAAKGPPEDDE